MSGIAERIAEGIDTLFTYKRLQIELDKMIDEFVKEYESSVDNQG